MSTNESPNLEHTSNADTTLTRRHWQILRMSPTKGPSLRYGVSLPEGRTPEEMARFLVFVNGRTEWIEKYACLPADFELEDDIGFLSWDHRGQGASGGERAFVESYSDYACDTQRIINKAIKRKPFIMIGHSMGGLIALYATMKGLVQPDALILSSPLLGLPEKPVPEVLARPLAGILGRLPTAARLSSGAGGFTKGPFEKNPLTTDHDRYEFIKATPYPLGGVKFGWVRATFEAIDFVSNPTNLKKFATPTLVLCGSDERVVAPDGIQKWIAQAAAHAPTRIEFDLIHGARHELFSESPDFYQKAIDLVRQFID